MRLATAFLFASVIIARAAMVSIPATNYWQGDLFSDSPNNIPRPAHLSYVDAFKIEDAEITNDQLAAILNWASTNNLIAVTNDVLYLTGKTNILLDFGNFGQEISYVSSNAIYYVKAGRGSRPAGFVTWFGAVAFCNFRSAMDGLPEVYDLSNWSMTKALPGYRLPTEAEWELAARGGAISNRFAWSHTLLTTHTNANYKATNGIAYDVSVSLGYHPDWDFELTYSSDVMTFPTNDFGLYDMSGNVWEWVWDWYATYPSGSVTNYTGPSSGTSGIFRGGAWMTTAERITVWHRYVSNKSATTQDVGFRMAMTPGTTRHVSTNGTNSGSADSWANAWRTLAYAEANSQSGDTILVGAGTYDEYVYISGITNLNWVGVSNATTRAFRIGSPSNTISGMRIIGAQNEGNTWDAYVRLEPSAHSTVITNCWIGDAPQVTATNFTFNADTDTIYSPSVDFVSAGFRTNGVIYWGGVSMTNYFFANMAKSGTITGVTSNTLYIADGAIDQTETNSAAWSYIYPGSTYRGIRGVMWVVSGGTGATNCLVSGNTFTNIPGYVWDLNGYNHTITGNRVVRNVGNKLATLKGSNHQITSNWVSDCILPIYYSAYEFNNLVYHPAGGGFYDFISGFFHTDAYATTWNTNVTIAWNWFENIEQPLSSINAGSYKTNYGGWQIKSNVFIGVMRDLQGGVNNFDVSHNTFYRCAYDEGYVATLALGSSGITNLSVTNNLFLDCGDRSNTNTGGGFTISYTYGTINTNGNVLVKNEMLGGIMAVRDPENPRGADGIPWTADDGLRPIPGSALSGKGALADASGAVAHFRPVTGLGWHEQTGSNYNVGWQQTAPYLRTSVYRPYTNPPTLGAIPFTTTFQATNSVSATWSTSRWIGIRDFVWNFGDGSRSVWTRWPDVSRTATITNHVAMTLTVTNSSGATATTTRKYRIAPVTTFTNDIWHVASNGNDSTGNGSRSAPWLTITNAIMQSSAGDYISVGTGNYGWIDPTPGTTGGATPSGSNGLPITVVSYGAKVDGVSQERDYWTWEGFECEATNATYITGSTAYAFRTAGTRNGITNRNWYIHSGISNIAGAIQVIAVSGNGGSNHAIINCHAHMMGPGEATFSFSGATNVLVDGNIQTYGYRQCDFLRLTGSRINVTRNYDYMSGWQSPNHIDFFQFLGAADTAQPMPCTDFVLRQNWVESLPAYQTEICSSSTYTNASLAWSNGVAANNVFLNLYNGFNGLRMDGWKIYNNLFYRIETASAVLSTGGDRGSSYGLDIRNNIFFQCGEDQGASTSTGWYQNGLNSWQTNVTFAFVDFNFVTGSNYAAKLVAPPDATTRWAITGQEMHGINGGDPGFNDPANLDFRLKTDSILYASGTDLSSDPVYGNSTDFFGDTRTTWSIGPFEPAEIVTPLPQPPPPPQPGTGQGRWRTGRGLIRGQIR